MSQHDDGLSTLMAAAAREGILPPDAARPEHDVRPWPLVLMTAFGAWLAAVPMLLLLGFMLGDFLERGIGTYLVAVLVLAGACAVIRLQAASLFLEQLAIPALLVGGALLGYALFRDAHSQVAGLLLGAACLALAAILPRDWLRVLLGFAACGLLALCGFSSHQSWSFNSDPTSLFIAWMLALGVWLGAHWLQKNSFADGRGAPVAAYIESVSTGWVLAVLVGLIMWSGKTFLLGASMGDGWLSDMADEVATRRSPWQFQLLQAFSVALAVVAGAWSLHRWPSLRQLPALGVALVLAVLAWFMPALGVALLVIAYCLTSSRLRVAIAAGLAAAWIIGGFYYQLAWPLASKALLLAVAGLVLVVMSWLAARGAVRQLVNQAGGTQAGGAQAGGAQATPHGRLVRPGVLAGLLLVLAVANIGIWQKERLISEGQPVFIALAPADPRSLMQGDFMRLNFLALNAFDGMATEGRRSKRAQIVMARGERGVASTVGLYDGKPLAPGQFLMELTPKDGRWVLVTDAWYFREGEAARWEKARYGEFRVMPDGRALLVGMRGEHLEAL